MMMMMIFHDFTFLKIILNIIQIDHNEYHVLKFFIFVKFTIPGKCLPSKSSKEAPPPVLIWLTNFVPPAYLTKLAESPPPIIVVAPL